MHQICKDHIENGLSLRECVDKYILSCNSLVQDCLRLGSLQRHEPILCKYSLYMHSAYLT